VLTFQLNKAVPMRVLDVLPAFPGAAATSGITVVTSRDGLRPFLNRQTDPEVPEPEGLGSLPMSPFSASIWSTQGPGEVRRALAAADVPPQQVATMQQVRATPPLLASAWAVGYLGPLQVGAVLLMLGAGALLARRLLDRDLVTDLMLRHMGWSTRELLASRTREVVAVFVVAGLAGALAVALMVVAPTSLESVPEIPPEAEPRATWGAGAWWATALASALLAAYAVLVGGARGRAPEEVLRDTR
jgi:hypothetical protein